MPSPFPGMDPFMEHPDFFPDLHGAMQVYIREALQGALPERYFAVINERLWVETSARYIEPDTDLIHRGSIDAESGGAVALAKQTRTQPLVFEITDDERSEAFIEVRTREPDEGERVVTVIEILSLSNKAPATRGRELYLQKQQEVLGSAVNLVEVDLLRDGQHTTPLSLTRLRARAGTFDYHVSIHRFDQPERFFVYPWSLEASLPEIAIPLLPADGDVALDLQAVFTRCYDTGPYRRRVVYDPARIVPPLDAQRARWAQERLDRENVNS